jgi:hypothetical protein
LQNQQPLLCRPNPQRLKHARIKQSKIAAGGEVEVGATTIVDVVDVGAMITMITVSARVMKMLAIAQMTIRDATKINKCHNLLKISRRL